MKDKFRKVIIPGITSSEVEVYRTITAYVLSHVTSGIVLVVMVDQICEIAASDYGRSVIRSVK